MYKLPITLPLDGAKATEELYEVPFNDNSKPTPAFAVISLDKAEPETASVCAVDGVP